eukprot:12487361-Alexandrium_andersonii.AAC.1
MGRDRGHQHWCLQAGSKGRFGLDAQVRDGSGGQAARHDSWHGMLAMPHAWGHKGRGGTSAQ